MRKQVLPANDSRDEIYVSVGGILGGLLGLYAVHALQLHNDFLRLLVGVIFFAVGLFVGGLLYSRLFVKDQSWQPPVLDGSWDEYRGERRRWVRGDARK